MKWLRRLLLVALVLTTAAIAGWWLMAPRLVESVRQSAETELSRVFASEVHIETLRLTLAPLGLEIGGAAVGPDGGIIRLEAASLRLDPWATAFEWRPVVDLDADHAFVDIGGFPHAREKEEKREPRGTETIPGFRVRRAHIADARVALPAGTHPLEVGANEIDLRVDATLGLQLTGSGRLSALRATRGGETVDLGNLQLAVTRTANGFRFDVLRLEGGPARIDVAAEAGEASRHTLRTKIDLAPMSRLDRDLGTLTGTLDIEATVDGPLDDPKASAHLRARDLAWREAKLDQVEAEVAWQARRVEVRSAHAVGFGGELTASGSLSTAERLPFEVRGDWSGVDLQRAIELADAHLPRAITTNGKVNATGALEPLAVEGSMSGRLSDPSGVDVDFDASGHAAPGAQKIELDARQGASNRVRADVAIGAERRLDGTLAVDFGDTSPLGPLLGAENVPRMEGTLNAAVRLSGTTSQPEATGNVTGRDVAALGARFTRVAASFRADRRRLDSEGIDLGIGSGSIRASGTIGFVPEVANTWQAKVDDLPLGDVAAVARALGHDVPLSGGTLSLTAHGSGPWSAIAARADATARDFSISGERFESLQLAASTDWPRWTAAVQAVHQPEELLSLRLNGDATRTLSADIDSTRWALDNMAVARGRDLTGEVSLQARLTGAPAALEGHASVKLTNVYWEERAIADATIEAEGHRGTWTISSDLLDGAVQARGDVVPGGNFAAEARLNEVHLAPLLSDDPTLVFDVSGTARLTAPLRAPARLTGEIDLSRFVIASGSFRAEAAQDVRIAGRDGRFAIESLHLQGSGTELNVTGTADTSGAVNVSARGAGSLQLLEAIGRPIQSVRGKFTLVLDARAAPGAPPELNGSLELADAALDVGLPFGPTETNASFHFARSAVHIDRFEGHLGGGTFAIGGSVDLATGPSLTWNVTSVSTGLVPSLEHEISGSGNVSGTWDEPTIGGELQILRALYDKRIEIRDLLPSFRRELARAPTEREGKPARKIVLDVRVFAPDELYIDNNFARLEAQADLRLRGTTAQPTVSGRVQVLTGEIYFRDRTFEVRTGTIDFRRQLGLNAYLNIVAESEIPTPDATYTVTMHITGRTDDVRVLLTADDSSLTQNDIVSLIAFGRTAAQLEREGGGVALGEVLDLAPGGYAGKIQRGTAKLLRVDRFEIEPTFSRVTGEFEPQLSVAKNFTEDFTATLASTFGVTGRQLVELSYRITPHISLLAGWESESQNQASAFSTTARFRFTYRDTPGFSLLHPGRSERQREP